jgi:2',3'-cyclic-nucleotide 2'-phosphodiesterase/3'-nucleotidase
MRTWITAFLLIASQASTGQPAPQSTTVTLLATTDLHGNLLPIDYVTGKPAARGLAKIATLIRTVREESPNTLLIDCGDTIQGTPLESVYQADVRKGGNPAGDPMMNAMSLLGYDAMTVGNHEFNVGLKNLDRARRDARFPWLSANTVVARGASERPFAPYLVKTVGGVKVAVIGVTTPVVPLWERPENLGGYRFTSPVEAVRAAIVRLRSEERPDVIVVAAHSGLGRNARSDAVESADENVVYDLAVQVPELDAIVFGHSHLQLEGRLVGHVLLMQPKNWGESLGRIDFTVQRDTGASWRVVSKTSRLIPVTAQTPVAPDLVALAEPYEAATERYLNTPVATVSRELAATGGFERDNALVDAIQRVQLFYAKADVSFTALFNAGLRIPSGEVTVRQLAALYPYDNQLLAIEGNGKMVKDALENAARFFSKNGMPSFNYDMAAGVEYDLDRSRPDGDRIRNLRYHGQPLAPETPLRIAVNSYRYGGSGGYEMFRGAKILWRSPEDIRDLAIAYYTERKTIPVEPFDNWKLVN